jgi:hypothetical protein
MERVSAPTAAVTWFCGDQMQFDRLKWCEFIPPAGSAAAPSPRTCVERHDSAPGSPHRRELLQGLLVATLAAAAGWDNDAVAASLPLERDRFVGLSEKLCAMSIADGSLADAIQNALADNLPEAPSAAAREAQAQAAQERRAGTRARVSFWQILLQKSKSTR